MSGATLQDIAVDLIPERWGLTANEKHVLVQLSHAADYRTDNADVGLPRIARRTGLSVDTVRRCIRTLSDGGWVAVLPQDRPNGATSTNCYSLNYEQIVNAHLEQRAEEDASRAQWRERFSKGAGSTVQGGAGSTLQGAPLHGARGKLSNNNSINPPSGAPAREDWKAFEAEVKEAAGDAPDPTAPGILAIYPLMALMSAEPPCTMTQITQGVRKAAAWYAARGLNHKMRNWDMAVKMALEFRDIPAYAVKEPAKAQPAASETDVTAWSIEQWRGAVKAVRNRGGGVWPPGWGPEPGAEGSAAPPEIVELWERVTT